MKILFNATTLVKGGTLPICTDLICQALQNSIDADFQFALSAAVVAEYSRFGPLPPGVQVFDRSPARSTESRKRLREFADRLQPDVVYTVFGPAYVRFAAPHVMGFADGWVTHSGWTALKSLRFPGETGSIVLSSLYKTLWIRRADAWIVQTETARRGLHRRLQIDLNRISVVSNTCGEQYQQQAGHQDIPAAGTKIRILCFAAAYSHKNIELTVDLAWHLSRIAPDLDFEIVVTLPQDHRLWQTILANARRHGVENRIINRGPVPVAEGPALYRDCHICFLPTLLETFSATYPEAMAMGLPIITTDLDFAHSICHDAALYFPPGDAPAAASQIHRLVNHPMLWRQLVGRGREVLAALPDSRQVYESVMAVLRKCVRKRRTNDPPTATH